MSVQLVLLIAVIKLFNLVTKQHAVRRLSNLLLLFYLVCFVCYDFLVFHPA